MAANRNHDKKPWLRGILTRHDGHNLLHGSRGVFLGLLQVNGTNLSKGAMEEFCQREHIRGVNHAGYHLAKLPLLHKP